MAKPGPRGLLIVPALLSDDFFERGEQFDEAYELPPGM
jgi:hypothetical protein